MKTIKIKHNFLYPHRVNIETDQLAKDAIKSLLMKRDPSDGDPGNPYNEFSNKYNSFGVGYIPLIAKWAEENGYRVDIDKKLQNPMNWNEISLNKAIGKDKTNEGDTKKSREGVIRALNYNLSFIEGLSDPEIAFQVYNIAKIYSLNMDKTLAIFDDERQADKILCYIKAFYGSKDLAYSLAKQKSDLIHPDSYLTLTSLERVKSNMRNESTPYGNVFATNMNHWSLSHINNYHGNFKKTSFKTGTYSDITEFNNPRLFSMIPDPSLMIAKPKAKAKPKYKQNVISMNV